MSYRQLREHTKKGELWYWCLGHECLETKDNNCPQQNVYLLTQGADPHTETMPT